MSSMHEHLLLSLSRLTFSNLPSELNPRPKGKVMILEDLGSDRQV